MVLMASQRDVQKSASFWEGRASVGERGLKYLEHHSFVQPRVYLEQFSWLCVCINDQDVAPEFL